MYCLQMNDMPDYDILKRSLSREDTILSQNIHDLSTTQSSADAENPKSPPATSVSPQPRFHPYEEIVIPSKRNARPQFVPPYRKPKAGQDNGRDTLDYYSTDL